MSEHDANSEDQQAARKALANKIKELQIEQQKRGIVKKVLTPDAYERLMNVRVANYELYSQLLNLIIAMMQSNKLYSKLTEQQLKEILGRLTQRPETKIEFKHK